MTMATDEANWCRVDAAPLDAAVTVYILSSSWTESPAVSQLLLLRQLHANRYYIIQLFTTMTLELTNSNDKKHICNELQKTFTVNFIYQGQSQQKLKKMFWRLYHVTWVDFRIRSSYMKLYPKT